MTSALRFPAAALAALALGISLAACMGGGDEKDDGNETYTLDGTAACLRRAGARVDANAGEEFENRLAERGAIEGSRGGIKFAVVFEGDGAKALNTEQEYAATAGGSWQPGARLEELLKRADNAVLAYERKPTPKQAKPIEQCLGGSPKLTASVAAEFSR
ncbi:MAG: hypothetical protein ABR583_00290 [Gaiellaceae bacterium]